MNGEFEKKLSSWNTEAFITWIGPLLLYRMSINKVIFNLLDFNKWAEQFLVRLWFMGYSSLNAKQLWSPSSANLDWNQATKCFAHLEYILGQQCHRRPSLQTVLWKIWIGYIKVAWTLWIKEVHEIIVNKSYSNFAKCRYSCMVCTKNNQSWYSHIKLKAKRIETKLKWSKCKNIKEFFFFFVTDEIHGFSKSTRKTVLSLSIVGI